MAHEQAPQLRDLGFSTRWTVFSKDGSVIQRYEKRHHLALSAYMRGLLLQHYGAPTAWLDITRDSTVARWFALQTMQRTPDGVRASPHTWGGTDPSRWPTVYVFPLVYGLSHFLDSETILQNTPALRPQRQRCGLLGGAGNLARNYGARYIGLKIRLAPGFTFEGLPAAGDLFPGPEEDQMLRELLEHQGSLEEPRQYPIYEVLSE